MSYETVDDFVRQADARPQQTKKLDLEPKANWTVKPPIKTTPKPATVVARPHYQCPELGRTCHRPGAYDAYALSSMYNGVLKPYRFSNADN